MNVSRVISGLVGCGIVVCRSVVRSSRIARGEVSWGFKGRGEYRLLVRGF